MTAGLKAVLWKESKGIFRYQGSRIRAVLTIATLLMLGFYLAFDSGVHWFTGFPSVLMSIAIPVMIVGTMIPDSFAGERERHTLETLLASSLSDREILTGKLIVPILFSFTLAIFVLILGAIVVNIRASSGTFQSTIRVF